MNNFTATGIPIDEFFVRLLLALIFGGAVGLEREKHGRAAGFRTNMLVCMGAALVMMCSQEITVLFNALNTNNSVTRVDPSRIASGIIMGIGFLGAGAIIKQESFMRGLTTAACLWFVTGVGIALGLGMYWWGLGATVFALIVLLPLKRLERLFEVDRYGTISIMGDPKTVNRAAIEEILRVDKVQVQTYHVSRDNATGEKSFLFHVKFAGQVEAEKITDQLAALTGVKSVSWR